MTITGMQSARAIFRALPLLLVLCQCQGRQLCSRLRHTGGVHDGLLVVAIRAKPLSTVSAYLTSSANAAEAAAAAAANESNMQARQIFGQQQSWSGSADCAVHACLAEEGPNGCHMQHVANMNIQHGSVILSTQQLLTQLANGLDFQQNAIDTSREDSRDTVAASSHSDAPNSATTAAGTAAAAAREEHLAQAAVNIRLAAWCHGDGSDSGSDHINQLQAPQVLPVDTVPMANYIVQGYSSQQQQQQVAAAATWTDTAIVTMMPADGPGQLAACNSADGHLVAWDFSSPLGWGQQNDAVGVSSDGDGQFKAPESVLVTSQRSDEFACSSLDNCTTNQAGPQLVFVELWLPKAAASSRVGSAKYSINSQHASSSAADALDMYSDRIVAVHDSLKPSRDRPAWLGWVVLLGVLLGTHVAVYALS